MLKKLPDDPKYNQKTKIGKEPLFFSRDSVALNSTTGMNNFKKDFDSSMTMNTAGRTTTAQSEFTGQSDSHNKRTTRKQIIEDFLASQKKIKFKVNWPLVFSALKAFKVLVVLSLKLKIKKWGKNLKKYKNLLVHFEE